MPTVLLTGFAPFLSYNTNPSGNIARSLNGKTVGDATVLGRVLPVEHKLSAAQLHEFVVTEKPDVIIGMGIFASRGCISLENIAINRYYYKAKDAETGVDEMLYEDGKDAYFSTLPLIAIKDSLETTGIPVEQSFNADTFVSNEVFYEIMRASEKFGIKKAGFIHLPLSHSNFFDMKSAHYLTKLRMPSMDEATMEKAIKLAITESVKLI